MYRVEERTAEDTLSSLVSHQISGTIEKNDEVFARIQSFQSHFATLTRTPHMLRLMMQNEFNFLGVVDVTDDKREMDDQSMLENDWFDCTFAVIDFGRAEMWTRKIHEEAEKGKTIVAIIPARTSQKWFHELVLNAASDIRFIQGNLMPNNALSVHGKSGSSMPACCIAIYKGYIPKKSRDVKGVGILRLNTTFTEDKLDLSADVIYENEEIE